MSVNRQQKDQRSLGMIDKFYLPRYTKGSSMLYSIVIFISRMEYMMEIFNEAADKGQTRGNDKFQVKCLNFSHPILHYTACTFITR